MEPSAVIRPSVPDDLAELVDIWVLSWRATLVSIDFDARRDWFQTYLSDLQATGSRILCAADPLLCGFAVLDVTSAVLHQIAVLPERFGAGIGLLLLDAAKQQCPERLTLTVNQDNPRAVRFYRRAGFAITGDGTSPNSGLRTWDMAWTPTGIAPTGSLDAI